MPLTETERLELEQLRQENAQLKKDYELLSIRAENFARESFLVELRGTNHISADEY